MSWWGLQTEGEQTRLFVVLGDVFWRRKRKRESETSRGRGWRRMGDGAIGGDAFGAGQRRSAPLDLDTVTFSPSLGTCALHALHRHATSRLFPFPFPFPIRIQKFLPSLPHFASAFSASICYAVRLSIWSALKCESCGRACRAVSRPPNRFLLTAMLL